MKSMPGMRPPVAKLINDIERINDSDVIYKYVEDIASYYTSELKTEERIIEQYEIDVRTLVNYYNMVYERYVGYEPKTELEKVLRPRIEPDKHYKIVVSNLLYAIEFLIYQTANNHIFLPLEKFEELGLKNVKFPKAIVLPKIENVSTNFKANNLGEYWAEFQKINIKNKGKVERVIDSVYDSAISFYKANGYFVDIPEIPTKFQRIFKLQYKCAHFPC